MNEDSQRRQIRRFLNGKAGKEIDAFCIYQWIDRCHYHGWYDVAVKLSSFLPPNSLDDHRHKRLEYLLSECREKFLPVDKTVRLGPQQELEKLKEIDPARYKVVKNFLDVDLRDLQERFPGLTIEEGTAHFIVRNGPKEPPIIEVHPQGTLFASSTERLVARYSPDVEDAAGKLRLYKLMANYALGAAPTSPKDNLYATLVVPAVEALLSIIRKRSN